MRALVGLLILLNCILVGAQPVPPDPPPPNPVPISGIEILIGAGALLGAKRFLHLRKPKT